MESSAEDRGEPGPAWPEPIRRDPHPGLLRFALHRCYDLVWLLGLLLLSPLILWRSLRRPGFGRMVLRRLGADLPQGTPGVPRVLVHGVSVGEVKAARPFVRELKRLRPDVEVVISTTTQTGHEVARRLFQDLEIVHFPADLSPVVARFLDRVAPSAVALVELEIWPNFLRGANRRGIPVGVVNGRITARSFPSYRLFKDLLPQFNRISLFCSQAPDYSGRFLALRVPPARLRETGNLKIDDIDIGRVDPGPELRRLLGGGPDQLVIVAGSTHAGEETMAVRAWRQAVPGARLVLVPRHPDRLAEVLEDLHSAGVEAQRLTRLRAGEVPDPARPVVVDTIGELEAVFGLADLAFVGGSLVPLGGHNLLEPAIQGVAVLSGPHLDNFQREAELLGSAGALEVVEDAEHLARALAALAADPERRLAMGRAGQEAIRARQGAARVTAEAFAAVCLVLPGPA